MRIPGGSRRRRQEKGRSPATEQSTHRETEGGGEIRLRIAHQIDVYGNDGSPGNGLNSVGQPHYLKASSFSSRQSNEQYDYIIVGGGTAGCPLAATLSHKYKVLLLERGGSPYGNANVSYLQNFHIGLADTSSTSAAQPFISTDGVINARARVLGGGTCINAGFYTRASSSYIEKAGWDTELVNESYPWVEKQIVHLPDVAPWQAAVRDGLLQAGVDPFNGFTYDHIYGTKVGGTIFNDVGYRSTAADILASSNPKNLHVLLYATAQKILFDKRGRSPVATGVEFKDEFGNRHEAYVKEGRRSEVIVTSGTLGSSQLLMLSGIGPKNELKRLNIQMLHHNRHVGKGLADNPMNTIFIPTKKPIKQSLIQIVGITKTGSFIEASSGFGQHPDSIRCNHGIMSAEIGQLSTIPPKQRTLEAAKAYAENKHMLPREVFQGGFLLAKVDGPLSTGHLTLIDSNVDTTPNVTFNYFSHPQDLRRCVNGIRTLEQIVQSKRLTELTDDYGYTNERLLNLSVKANVNFIPKHTNDTSSLEQFCRDTVVTIWHHHGGCQVGKVVDTDYRVVGVGALRVIDSSTFLSSPGTNPQATVLMLGRYMGVKILRSRLGRAAGV